MIRPLHDPAAAMDRMYRVTRHFYDLTRKYYLLGRDRLLREMDIRPGDSVLEVGCGTGRNLMKLARRHPRALFYGLDVSQQMLSTARKKINRAGLDRRIFLRQGLAEHLDFERHFTRKKPFDVVYFSYSLSMIPDWRNAIDAAIANLAAGRALYLVDFWDQRGLPRVFRSFLKKWLELFHVEHRPELIAYFKELEKRGMGEFQLKPVLKHYALIGKFLKK
jgi:S-adenosylmethionine-diacylgycerolhomoserine-N-methlytransferase